MSCTRYNFFVLAVLPIFRSLDNLCTLHHLGVTFINIYNKRWLLFHHMEQTQYSPNILRIKFSFKFCKFRHRFRQGFRRVFRFFFPCCDKCCSRGTSSNTVRGTRALDDHTYAPQTATQYNNSCHDVQRTATSSGETHLKILFAIKCYNM